MSRFRFTAILPLAAAVLCLFHYLGFDPKNLMLMSLSVPLWFAPIFTNLENVNLFAAYALTIGSWAFIGYGIDYFAYRRKTTR